METKKWLHIVAFILVIVGGINWGLFGAFGFDFVDYVFGGFPTVAEIIYVLIGVSAVYLAVTHGRDCKLCAK